MKKTTTKKAPAPKAAPAPVPAAPVSKAPAKKTAAAPAAPARKKPAVKSEPPATFISARIDIGFGNHLYVRGEGPGLSWDHGVAMDCVGAGLWTISVANAAAPVAFKVLVNDLSWNAGPDYIVEPGQSITVEPTF